MVQGCGSNFIKYCVIFVNVLVCLVGLAILGTSLGLIFSSNFQQYFVDVINAANPNAGGTFDALKAIFYLTAAVGALIFLTGFLGCCGAACESTCLLGIFFTIILIMFLIELGAGIAALAMQSQFETAVNNFYGDTVVPNYVTDCGLDSPTSQQNDLITSWNNTQNILNCCGCNGISDYKGIVGDKNCGQFCYAADKTTGCCSKLWDELQDNIWIIGGVAIGLLVVELLAMIFSCCLCSSIRNKYRNYA